MIVSDLKAALDPVVFARTHLGFVPDQVQAKLLRSRAKRGLLNCCRQWGKSTTTAAKATHELVYAHEPVVAIAAPGARQANEIRLKVETFLSRLGESGTIVRRGDDGFWLKSGGRLVVLPGSSDATVRGVSAVTMLIVDEAARVKAGLRKALSPFLAVRDGCCWELSTPFGKRGFFYEHWQSDGWEKISVPATECPRISEAFLKSEQAELGDWWFRQEYLCEFLDIQGSAFDHTAVLRSLRSEVKPLWQE